MPWIRGRSWSLVAVAPGTHSTRPPCQFLDHGVNAGEEISRGRGNGIRSALPRRAAHWLVARGRRRCRHPGRAARLAEAGRRCPGRIADRKPPARRRRSGRPSKRSTCSANGWRPAPRCRSPPPAPGACFRKAPNMPAIMLLSEAPALEDHAAGQPIGGEAWELPSGCWPRSRSRRAGLQRLALLPPRAGRADERRPSARPAPRSRASTSGSPSQSGCCCSATARRRRCSASRCRKRAGTSTRSKACAPSPPSIRAHLINQPSNKSLAWRDLLLLMEDKS